MEIIIEIILRSLKEMFATALIVGGLFILFCTVSTLTLFLLFR